EVPPHLPRRRFAPAAAAARLARGGCRGLLRASLRRGVRPFPRARLGRVARPERERHLHPGRDRRGPAPPVPPERRRAVGERRDRRGDGARALAPPPLPHEGRALSLLIL